MANTNLLLNAPEISHGRIKKYTVSLADIVALGAFTTGIITLDTLPAGTVMQMARLKHSAAVGIATSLSARLYYVTDLGSGALDVFAAPGTTLGTHEITDVTPRVGLISGTNLFQIKFTNGGANLSTATAGSIDVWAVHSILY